MGKGSFGCGDSRGLIRQVSQSLDWGWRALRSANGRSLEGKKGGAPENELKVWGPQYLASPRATSLTLSPE